MVVLLAGHALEAAPMLPATAPLPPERERAAPTAPIVPPEIPMPPVKPDLPPAIAAVPPVASADEIAGCDRWLASGMADARHEDAPAPLADGCGIPLPVRVTAVHLASGKEVTLAPAPLLACRFAATYAAWVRDDLAPLLESEGGGLARVIGGPGYECRTIDHLGTTNLSEHALGDAIDVIGFALRDGSGAGITKVEENVTLFAKAKIAACARFATVLGPGSDKYHSDNLHLDGKQRRNGYRMCQWQLP